MCGVTALITYSCQHWDQLSSVSSHHLTYKWAHWAFVVSQLIFSVLAFRHALTIPDNIHTGFCLCSYDSIYILPIEPLSSFLLFLLPPPSPCPLTCPLLSSLTAHLPRLSPISSRLSSFLSRLSLHAWIAAVILVSPSAIRGRCWNRCITGRHPTTQHSSGQALYHLSSLTARWKKEK